MKNVGIITFHNSYNCGSMLETYAIQQSVFKIGFDNEIIDYSNEGQKKLYDVWFREISPKNIIKNILIFPFARNIKNNNIAYETFKKNNFKLSKEIKSKEDLSDKKYHSVIAGSDQIWNITIADSDDAYFLDWVDSAKKIAYAPSFGAKNILQHSPTPEKYSKLIADFDSLSIRENNGKRWIKDMINKDINVLLDPTLLLEQSDYDKIINKEYRIPYKYIFFYSPGFDAKICKYVKKIAKKYNLKVITWSSKPYHVNLIRRFGFKLPKIESPDIYLNLIKNAELVITTSYHGTIFSTIYKKKFITVKNGGMYGDDDRVITLLEQLNMMDRLIPYTFDNNFDYLSTIDYSNYDKKITILKKKSLDYLKKSLEQNNEKRK